MIDRLIVGLRTIVRGELSRLTWLGCYGYTVQRAGVGTVDAAPRSALPLPTLVGVPLISSLLGQTATPSATGAPCLIRFVNGDPTRPVCVSIGAPAIDATIDATGTLALGPSGKVSLAGGTKPIAREGDGVTVFLPASMITGTLSGSPFGPLPMQATTALAGIIQSTSRASA